MPKFNVLSILLFISILLIGFIGILIGRMKNKQQIHYAFLSNLVFLLIWSLARMSQIFVQGNDNLVIFLEHISYIGVILVPISLLYVGLIFAKTQIKFSRKHLLLFLIPIISLIMVFTNNYHHLFIVKYSFISTGFEYGKYYIIHELYSYLCILVGLYYLLYFSIKNSGFFSKQSILIFLGILVPLLVVILSTQEIVAMPVFIENISFSFAMICFMFAIFKFNFLNVMPIALQRVVDLISDGFVVIDGDFKIIDYNSTLVEALEGIATFNRKDNLIGLVNSTQIIDAEKTDLATIINRAVEKKKTFSFEQHIERDSFDKYFTIEITPIFNQDKHIGTIILLKDITQHKQDIEVIKNTQKQLTERERLASLGELAGGVAHDINSPLSAIQTGQALIERLIQKCYSTIGEENLNEEARKYFKDIGNCINTNNSACQKIVKIVNSVRNHTRNLSGETIQEFYIKDVVEDLKILLNHQLKQNGCELNITEVERKLVKGDPGKLSQVLTNLIVNAMQAYNGNPGKVEVEIGTKDNNVLISVEDKAGGIPEEFRDGIFKNILTTKGTQGTGLGLYLSYSIITGHFGGDMWFESEEGKGTTFFISIPIIHIN